MRAVVVWEYNLLHFIRFAFSCRGSGGEWIGRGFVCLSARFQELDDGGDDDERYIDIYFRISSACRRRVSIFTHRSY